MKKKELKIKDGFVLCSNCGTFADWNLSIAVGWIGCAPCVTGEADSFDPGSLILKEYAEEFLDEFNQFKKHEPASSQGNP